MARLKITVHPLLYLFGLYFALTGKVFSFLTYTVSAVLHELGHYYFSSRLGYVLDKIVLMPYGAIIKGDDFSALYKDECLIALGGPLINLFIAVIFVACWWLVPSVYPYTELIVTANVSLALINLLPCYPLDGGRFLLATLSLIMPRKKAKNLVKALGFILGTLLFVLFIYSIFTSLNITVLFFSLFIFFGISGGKNSGDYVKIYSQLTYNQKLPRPVKKVAVSGDSLVKKLYPLLSDDYYYELLVITPHGERLVKGETLYKLLSCFSPYETLQSALENLEK